MGEGPIFNPIPQSPQSFLNSTYRHSWLSAPVSKLNIFVTKGNKETILFFSVLNNFTLSPSHCVHPKMKFANQPVLITGWRILPQVSTGSSLPLSDHHILWIWLLIGTLSHPQFTSNFLSSPQFFKDESSGRVVPAHQEEIHKIHTGQRLPTHSVLLCVPAQSAPLSCVSISSYKYSTLPGLKINLLVLKGKEHNDRRGVLRAC